MLHIIVATFTMCLIDFTFCQTLTSTCDPSCTGETCTFTCTTADQNQVIEFQHPPGTRIGDCGIACSAVDANYTLVQSSPTQTILTIDQVNSDRDNGSWICKYGAQSSTVEDINVYDSVPSFNVLCENKVLRCGESSLDMTGIDFRWMVNGGNSTGREQTLAGEDGTKLYTCTISGPRVTNCLGTVQAVQSQSCTFRTTTTTEATTTETLSTSQELSSTLSSEITSTNSVVFTSSGSSRTISSSLPPTTTISGNETGGLSHEDIILIIALGSVGFILLVAVVVIAVCCCMRSRKGNKQLDKDQLSNHVKNGKPKQTFDDPKQQRHNRHNKDDQYKYKSGSRMPQNMPVNHGRQSTGSGSGQPKMEYYPRENHSRQNRMYPTLEMHQYGYDNSGYYQDGGFHARGRSQRSHHSDPYYGMQPQYYQGRGNYTQSVGNMDRRQYETNWMY